MAYSGRLGAVTLAQRFGELSTSIKMLAIISLALVPLGLIALLASLQSSRTADLRRQAELRIAVTESTRNLAAELAPDLSSLGAAANALDIGASVDQVCARLAAILAASRHPTPFALYSVDDRPVCATGARPARPPRAILDIKSEAHLKGDGLDISVPSRSGGSVAVAHYPAQALGALARPSGFSGPLTLELQTPDGPLPLVTGENQMLLANQTYGAPVGLLDLSLDMTVDEVPFSAADALLTFLPLLMWASAAALGFLVVDRLLIGPLEALRAAVAAYRPGQPFVFPKMRTPAREIRELGQTVEKFGSELATHEAGLERALADQVKLTREVHHRVKNNLQVVASLISLHARGAASRDAAEAYASIQRRVDALAIVHRNHFAELDGGHGIGVKALIGELAANLRASVPADAIAPSITVTTAQLRITQDSAMPIAFLLTELTELSMAIDIAAPIAVSIDRVDEGHARLNIESSALADSAAFQKRLEARYSRIITGLARQMRATLDHDVAEGRYAIVFPVLNTV